MRGRLLLVEDDGDARLALSRALERRGFQCILAASVSEADTLLASSRDLDAVITDVVLGNAERGGLDVLAAARRYKQGGPVVIITAFASVDVVKAALNGGAGYLLEKPFRADELVRVVERLLEESRSVDHLIDRAFARVQLTEKEVQVARLVLKGLTSAEIAGVLHNSEKTIRQHVSQIYAKFSVTTRAEFFHHIFPS